MGRVTDADGESIMDKAVTTKSASAKDPILPVDILQVVLWSERFRVCMPSMMPSLVETKTDGLEQLGEVSS